jgi:hypothetical protein
MKNKLNPKENEVWRTQFSECIKLELRQDLIFIYPDGFAGPVSYVADKMQSSMDFLKDVTTISPIQEFGSRVVVGYTRKATQPNWSGLGGNRVHLPWKDEYLNKKSEPLDVCSHELVHPFYNRSPLHQSNEYWGDCFCEFLRGPVKQTMGLDGRNWWKEKLHDYRSGKQYYGNVAGQFLLKAKQMYWDFNEAEDKFIDHFIEDRESIKKFVEYLFIKFSHKSFDTEFEPTSKMRTI